MITKTNKPKLLKSFLIAAILINCYFGFNTNAQDNDDTKKQGTEIYEKSIAAMGGKEAQAKSKSRKNG